MEIEQLNIRERLKKRVFCPACGSSWSYKRNKTNDFICRRCGSVFRITPGGNGRSTEIVVDK